MLAPTKSQLKNGLKNVDSTKKLLLLKEYRHHLLLHLIIFMWGFTGILGKVIQLDALLIVWHRLWIAALFLALYVLYKKCWALPKGKQLLWTILVGLVVATHWLTFYTSIQMSTASLGILCLSTTTLHVTWLEPLIMKRKFSWLEGLLGVIVIGGIYFVAHDFTGAEKTAVIIGLLSALCAAIFSVANGKLAQTIDSASLSLTELSTGFIVLTGFFLLKGKLDFSLFEMRSKDFYWLLFLGILCTSFAFLATVNIVKKLGAFTVSLSINLEPIYTIILAIFILKEHKLLNSSFYWGASLIILVVAANGLLKHRQKLNANRINGNAIQ